MGIKIIDVEEVTPEMLENSLQDPKEKRKETK